MLKGSWIAKVFSASVSILASHVEPERWEPVISMGFSVNYASKQL